VNEEFTAPAPAGTSPVQYASFARRLGAALLDSLVWIVGLVFFNPFAVVGASDAAAAIIALLIASAWFNYFALCEWRWGQTIGKNATGIRVLPLEGGRLSWQAAALRNILRLVDLPLAMVGVDYLIVRGSSRRQRLGDRAAKTIVVRDEHVGAVEPPPPAAAPTGPTAAEIFGDAAEAMGRHPAAGSDSGGSNGSTRMSAAPAVAAADAPTAAAVPLKGIPSWVTWGPGLAVGGIFAALIAAIIFSIPVAAIDPNIGTDDGSVAGNVIAELIQVAALIGVPLAVVARQGGWPGLRVALERLGVRRFSASAFGWMALAVFAYLVVATIAYAILQPDQEDIAQDFGTLPVQILMVAIAAPIAEEISFRGFLFGGLRSRIPAIVAALASGALFGALHAPSGVSAVPQLMAFGAILALLYDKTGSIIPGVMLHVLNNVLGVIFQ
jgi:CAAX protease family protein